MKHDITGYQPSQDMPGMWVREGFDFQENHIGLIVDKDGFLSQEALPLAAGKYQLQERFREITDKGMNGEMEFEESFSLRLEELARAGATIHDIQGLTRRPDYVLPGARKFTGYFSHDAVKMMVTGGIIEDAAALGRALGFDIIVANEAGYDDNGMLTGKSRLNVNDKYGIASRLRGLTQPRFAVGGGDGITDYGIAKVVDYFVCPPDVHPALDAKLNGRIPIYRAEKNIAQALPGIEEYYDSLKRLSTSPQFTTF